MKIIEKIEKQINALALDEIVPFSYIKLENVSKDTIRKYLHRLHDRGLISIEKRGYFKKIKPFHEFLFVYGSLKKGFDNHKLLQKYAKRVGKASTVGKFAMYEDSFGNYPYLVKEPVTRVQGELYEIKRKELLDEIDEFEGAPEYYQRKRIKVKTHKGVNLAFAYLRENEEVRKEKTPLKIWENNTDYKVHKLDTFLESLH
jgi:gamma-glutamylcyclotransferase (GGCT)/AIG2-like uncharacterized protein YtfP